MVADSLQGLAHRLRGPPVALPRPLDRLADAWAALGPRPRLLIAALAIAVGVAGGEARVIAAEQRWGGPAVEVFVATSDLPAGGVPQVATVTVPPALVPPRASGPPADDAVLALPLPEGSVLTDQHLDPAGPAAGLDPTLRVLPLPVEEGWGVTAGGWVDVWVLGVGDQPAELVAVARPVIALEVEETGKPTALIGVAADEVGPTTTGLALGRVVLAHAPPP